MEPDRQQAHRLMDSMTPRQVSAVVMMLEAMLDPEEVALARIPYEDEPISEEEERAATQAKLATFRGEVTSHDDFLAELGFTPEDVERFEEAHDPSHAAR